MIRVFATLKLRLLRNLLRTDGGVAFVLFTLIALGTSGLVALGLLRAGRPIEGLLPLVAAAVMFSWTFGPLLFGSSDETIDTTRLALFPVPARQLAPGMTIANLIGPGPLAVLLPFLAASARADGPLRVGLAVMVSVSLVVLSSVLSRWVQTSLGSALRKRNRRDIMIVFTGLFAGVLGIGSQVLIFLGFSSDRIREFGSVARWAPGGWHGWAIQELQPGRSGGVGLALAVLAVTVAVVVLVTARWIRSLDRALAEVADSAVEEIGTRHFMDSAGLVGALFVRLGPLGPVLAKEVRYLRRHPRYRVQVISQFIVLILGGAPFLAAIVERDPSSVLVACVPALTAGITSSNLLGADGRALWGEVVAVESLSVVLRGRSLAFFFLGVTASIGVIIATAAWTGGWQFAPVALAASIGMGFAGAGTGAYTSTLAPVLLPDESNPNPFASGDLGQGCVSGIVTFLGALVGLLTAAPILGGLALARTDWWAHPLVIVGAPAYGAAVYLVATAAAARRADPRLPDLLAALS